MLRVFVRFAWFALALLGVWVLPSIAHAAITPVCDAPEVWSFVPPQEPSCEVVTTVDDETGETTLAPQCDPRGASAVAPPRLLPVADARLDAGPRCGEDPMSFSLRPSTNDNAPQLLPLLVLDPALLVEPVRMSPLDYEEISFLRETAFGALEGERLDIDRPPRS